MQNNMPPVSVRDIVVHGDDVAIATHGRGFWVMDQMNALREIAAQGPRILSSNVFLFKTRESYVIRTGGMNGTPLPHEEPQETNPPPGVLAHYWLKSAPAAPLKLELIDAANTVRACSASDTPVREVDTEAINVQAYWEQPAPPPSATAGMHRFALNAPAPRGRGAAPPPRDACSSSLVPAAAQQRGPGVRNASGLQPGDYTLRLTVDGQVLNQPVTLKPDPRNSR